jgi:hypothetical protein
MPDERLIMAVHRTRRVGTEAEPVLVSVSPDGRAELTIGDGDAYEFDLTELRSALGDAA